MDALKQLSAFDAALSFTLDIEGGESNNPHDNGGHTKCGVTQGTYHRWRAKHHLPRRSVSLITRAEELALYREEFWIVAHCPELADRLAICHFDWAVNHSPHAAIETLQTALGVTADGLFGPVTRTSAEHAHVERVVTQYLVLRRRWYRRHVQVEPDDAIFLAGWLHRVTRLQNYIHHLGAYDAP